MNGSQLFSLADRVALVTGGSKGIGRMIAEGFVAQGARVYIAARTAAKCEATAQELSEFGTCFALPADLSTREGIDDLVRRLRERESSLDILVNNAGTGTLAAFDDVTDEEWDATVDLNLKWLFFLTQALAPDLRAGASAERPSKVINIASIDAVSVNRLDIDTYAYHASKAAVVHLTKQLGVRLIRDHIVVSAIAPGAFVSDLNRRALDTPDELAAIIPARRIGTPEDLAGGAVFLASRAGDYVVGETLVIDGGFSIMR
ncbi:SDR family oxidoreductase [Amycolatopsis panacis]|uniref:SDR family oxidoreductase n=1 Tax=Amycolatopsis panacis TaxID=2340917 RepID=A0A419I2J2_9PSEU|nr:SDR family oxidoreductase [Amycolatopsis panacis]RJQ84182.1 SDR family oxidoreductase [Amycolatopsis panacis]